MMLVKSTVVGIIDYSVGNLTSVFNALSQSGIKWKRISSSDEFNGFSHLILPGVGAFKHGIDQLKSKNFEEQIKTEISKGTPFLGICLGMQLLFEKSFEFGEHKGLGLIKGEVRDLKSTNLDLTVPHMGWNDIHIKKKSRIFPSQLKSAYFVHSYYCSCEDSSDVLAVTDYGLDFCSAIEKDNIFGVQFHPEKSHGLGLSLLKSFGNL